MSAITTRTAVIVGAGSGIGRATAVRLAREGWQVALLGRRLEALQEVSGLLGHAALTLACDVADAVSVATAVSEALRRFGQIDTLVFCAGTNIVQRSWGDLSVNDYHLVLGTNLDGAFHCVQAVLPFMRRQGAGTIVMINSEAGRAASAKSGAAYVASKFGLAGLVQSLNAEERVNGIRACSIFPGDVNTPLLDRRPQPPSREARARMLQPEDVAECVWLAVSLPSHAIVEELVVRPA